jgi:Phosphatidylinositol kinase and protein kinases of the PI-3 kinase family
VLPRLIHLIYEQQKTGSTLAVISQLYKALLSQFNTHHPLGIDCKESFFVGDAEKWNSILKRVYYMIESEISHLQRSKETECNSDFIHLAVHLIGWFYNKSEEVSMCDVTIDLDTSVRAKRMKLTVLRIEYFIQVLEQSNSAYDIWPVLHIVACLVFRFPKLITSEEYKVLLQLFAAYQSNNFTNNEKIMDYLYEAFFSFLFALEHVTFPDDQVNQIWKNIFQNTNKIIGLNQCVRSSHLLLRYLLNLKYDLCHTDLLMQSYTDKVVSLNEESLKTLFFLISKVQINTETRLKLMDWIFQRTTTKITSLHLYTATATMFILCSNVRPLQLETSKSELDHFFAFLQPSSLEYFYTTNNFDQGIFTGKSKVITSWCSSYELDKFIDEKQIIFNESILKNMYEYWSRLVIIMSQKMTNDVLDVNSIDFILNNLSLWIYFSKYNHYLPPQCMLKQSLITSLPDLLSNVLQKLSRLNVLSAETHSTLFNLFHSINESQICLLSSVGTNIIGTFLAAVEVNQLPSGNFLETVMPLSTYPKVIKDLNFQKINLHFSDKQLKIFRHIILLTQFSCNTSGLLSDYQMFVISELFKKAEDYLRDGFKNMHLLTSTFLIDKVVLMENVDSRSMEFCVLTFLDMCKAWVRQSDVVEYILLPLLKKMLHKVQCKHETFREKLLSYLTNFYTLMNKGFFGASVQVKIVECFGLLAEIDSKIEWTLSTADCLLIKQELQVQSQPLIIEILAIVKSSFHSVRIQAIQYLPFIFQSSTLKILEPMISTDKMFDLLTNALEGTLLLDDNFTQSEYVDESVNRTASFLHAIASIISSCPCVSRKMLFYSCVMFVKKKFNVNLLRKLVFLILKHMNINVKQLMTENMFYILTAWYDSFETLLTFPYHILSLDINTFLNANLIHIVTVLYINKNGNEIGHYAKLLSKDVSSLVLVALPKILALGSRDMIVSSEQFESCDLVRNKLEDVLLELLCNVSDYKHLNMKACVPQPCASNITFIQLKSRLEFLTIKLDLNVSPIQYLCQNKPSSIQKIHLHLSRAIYEARSSEFRIEAIHRYEMFLQLLEPILNQSNDLILDFLIHSVIYTLLHTLGSSNEAVDCANIVLNCMNRFLHATLPQCSSIISTLLPCLVGSLVPITHAQLKKECLCIIEFLVVDHCKELREGILALDPFPHSEDYKVISQVYNNFRGYLPRTCLSKEIGHFVASTYSNPHCKITQQCRLEGLNNIDHLLTHERKDLNIINSSQLSNFELDKLEKMMNRLIFILSELARSPDSEISNKALVCLGKIGPYSMNSTALASHESQMNTAHTSNGDLMLTQVITAKLILYLSSSNVKVVSIASECLFNLLDTPEGRSIVDKLSSAQRKFIYPMLPTHNKCLVKASLEDLFDERKFKELIDVTGLWVPNTATTYERWISHLTANMIICFETSKCYLKYLIELCSIKTDFAEEILRYLIYFIIRIPSETREAENILTTRIGYFFSCHHNAVSSRNSTDGEIHMNKKAIKCLLDVIHFVRINQDSPDKTLLRVNYLHVAQAALYCSAPFSAIFYSHISSEQLCSELELEYRDQSLSTLDYICNYRSTEGPNLQDILRRAYTEINDLDAVQGCGNAHLRELSSRIVHYQNANNWQRVLQCSDILMSTSGQSEQMKMSLAKCGLYFIQTRISESQDLEASWRLSQWDYADDLSEEPTFDLYHYRALKCLHQGETIQCMDNINAARKSLVNFLCLTDMECTKQVQLVLSKLRMLQEIQEFTEVDSNDIIIHKWEENQFIGDVDFKLIEPILYQRCILLDESCDESMAIVPYYLKIAQRARIANHFHIAERILTTVDGKSLSKFDKFQVLFELSQLLWDRNEIEAARASLRIILPKMHDESKCKLIYSQALRTYGCWQASTKSENLSSIIRKYLQPALEILLCDQLHERLKAYNCLATYADEKQLQISDILISVSKMQRPDVPYGSKIEMKQQAIDARETETHKLERKTYLHMSMKYYIKSLAEGNLNDIKAFRVVSLWLDNIDDTDLLNMLAKSIITVPSYKFVKVLPQLVARISNVQNKPNALILQVIEKCAVDHPHHTLPLIMAVANSLKDEIYIKKSSELPVKSSTMESRIKGADYVIMKLKKLESPFCKNLVEITRQQEALSYAYIIFANYVLGDARYSASKHTIPSSQQLIKIKDFDQICVSTMNLKLNIDGIYDSIVGIHKFDRTYCIPGGVNEPKKITCIGTDGHRYIQLLKGKDDPRQDAVMQQVFTIMNDLLKSKRNLSVMTYKVVPLSQMSGIIEWCTNSLPVCLYLLGDNTTLGAHAKYNPQDITHRKCRECLEKLHKASAPTSKKLNEYLNICKKFKPVFRYFFLEQFQNPNEWYNMQTNYTRSVATSSMIGYILGLGDRHLNNILINLKTAQVIHIDFGIAFEQGLILPTPETVPFRLTRDVEDGMGVTGTEGTFKKTCETTLSVLRENSETLLTILEVLLYDPLYTWTLTPSKAAERQKVTNSKNVNTETNVPVNKIAARALFRLKQKLQGIEEGNVFSVEGQVSILIQRAKDPENLCRLFPGWQPYL